MLKKSYKQIRKWMQLSSRNYSSVPGVCNSTAGLGECPPKYVGTLKLIDIADSVPVYRLLDPSGHLLNPSALHIENELSIKIYKFMLILREMDRVLYECQRQGRISFYMTVSGEEASVIGSAAALNESDLLFPQYREAGALIWRGFTIEQCVNQCFGNKLDVTKSKQMPIHYGSKEHHYVTVSSPIATQLPQAVGAAYSYKLAQNGKCVLTYFGDGASSEGDAHAAFNFAATLECPVVLFCRNNGFAISTPVHEQFKVDGISARAAGYGIQAIKVDGNDVFAVYHATQVARDYVLKNNKPILIEALTYRKGHHSTSDDSLAYRSQEDIEKYEELDPFTRLKTFMVMRSWWSEEEDIICKDSFRKQILKAVNEAEKMKKHNWEVMFDDVYDELPEHLKEQKKYMQAHLKNFGEYYPLTEFDN